MKKIYLILSASALLAASCNKELLPEAGDDTEKACLSAVTEQQEDGTKTSMNSSKKVVWSASDQLSVLSCFGAKSSNNLFYVSSLNGSDPTVAQFSGDITTGRSVYYALYPYDDSAKYDGKSIYFSIPQTQFYAEDSFGPGANIAVAEFSATTDPLRFRNILGVFRLSLKGSGETVKKIVLQDRSCAPLWGNAVLSADDKLGTYAQTLELANGDNTLILDCSEASITLSPTARSFYFTAPAGSFAKGFDVYVCNDDGIKCHLGTVQDNSLIRSRILAMPETEATTSLENLSTRGTANCYMISTEGSYRFKVAKGCGGETFTPASVGILWSTEDTATIPASLETIISDVAYADGYITFSATGKKGNVLIGAFDGSGNIVWNWHIWSTGDYIRTVQYPVECKARIMDRDLGALSSLQSDGALCSGLNYQWGRKDPFMGAATVAAPSQKTTPPDQMAAKVRDGLAFDVKSNSEDGAGTMAYATAHPLTFISCANSYNDNDWLVGHDASLWQPTKTVNDPCPPGYRVPDKVMGWSMSTSDFSFISASRGYLLFGTEWYGEHGYSYRCTGGWCEGPYDGMSEWWGCSSSATDAYYLGLHMNTNKVTSASTTPKKANAYAVRCCADMRY